jgi:hypothetical protein
MQKLTIFLVMLLFMDINNAPVAPKYPYKYKPLSSDLSQGQRINTTYHLYHDQTVPIAIGRREVK